MVLTIDTEPDWGGRTETLQGIHEGIPIILDLMARQQLRGIFFLSTQHLDRYLDQAKAIATAGHLVGCHGDVHRSWHLASWHSWRIDYLHAMTKLEKAFGLKRQQIPYRAPRFSHTDRLHPYSFPTGHVSLLKHVWFHQSLQHAQVFYLHPFDLIKSSTHAPSFFTKILYSRWQEARQRFEQLLCSNTFVSVS